MKILNSDKEILEKIKSKGYWKIKIHPAKHTNEKIPLDQLKEIIEQCQVRQRGWDYPSIDRRNGKTFLADNYLTSFVDWNEFVEIWRFYQSGQFIQYLALASDRILYPPYSEGKNLEIILALYNITEFFIFAKNLASKKIMGDSIHIEIDLHNTNQRKLIISEPFRDLHGDYICQIDKLEVFNGDIPTPKLFADFAEIALDATVNTFIKFNWMNPAIKKILKTDQEKLLKGFF